MNVKRTSRQGRNNQRRRPSNNRSTAVDVWRTGAPLPALAPIEPATDVGALLRSLGDPPLHGNTELMGYFETVIERSAAIAAALALSVDQLRDPNS